MALRPRQIGMAYREARFWIIATRLRRGCGRLRLSGPGGHRYHMVARDVGRTRPPAGQARRGFQCLAIRIPDRAELQGQLHRNRDRGDLCVSFAEPARDCSGQRNRDRDHDGRKGRDLSRVRTDAGRTGGFFTGRVSSGRYRLLRRCRRQHAVVSVQCFDADPLLQQEFVS